MLQTVYRTQFIHEHDAMPNQDFIAALTIPDSQTPIALSIRRSLAKICEIPAECIYPNEPLTEIGRLIRGDEFDLILAVEKDLGILITRTDDLPTLFGLHVFGVAEKEFNSIADWLIYACNWIAQHRADRHLKQEEIEQRLTKLLNQAKDWLPDEQLNEMTELVTAGEPGVAFENFCVQLDEYQVSPPDDFLKQLVQLGNAMEIHPSYWQRFFK